MAIDSAAKRRSASAIIAGVFVVSVTPDATKALAWRQDAGWGYQGIAIAEAAITPTDDDADITVTTYYDGDGAVIRAARLTLLHAVNSFRNADLGNPERLDMDRHAVRSIRAARTPNSGTLHRLWMFTSRAGDAPAPRELIVTVGFDRSSHRVRAADTTNRTDADGTTMIVSNTRLRVASDSMRNADLSNGSTDRDRHTTTHRSDPSGARGLLHRVFLQADGRAGDCWAPKELILEAAVSGPGDVRAADR